MDFVSFGQLAVLLAVLSAKLSSLYLHDSGVNHVF